MFPEIGPYDVQNMLVGPGGIFEMGDSKGGQKIAWLGSLRLGFTYEESFSDPAMEGNTPLAGVVTLAAIPMEDPETGEIVEADVCSFSGNVNNGGWGLFHTSMRWSEEYRVCKGLDEYHYLQDPGIDFANPYSDQILIERG